MREIPDIPESVDELEGVGDGVALLVPDDVCICCEYGENISNCDNISFISRQWRDEL